jgi:tetratricopeptide (TPR) repeat protein
MFLIIGILFAQMTQAAVVNKASQLEDPLTVAIQHFNRGKNFEDKGQTQEALLEYDLSIKVFPGMYEAHVNRGVVLMELGKLKEAEKSILNGLVYNLDDTIAWAMLSKIHFKMELYDKSIDDAEMCLKVKRELNCYIRKGCALEKQKNFEEAHAIYDLGLRYFKTDRDLLFNRTLMSFKLFNLEMAERDFAEFKKYHPTDKFVSFFEGGLGELRRYKKTSKYQSI